MAPKITGIVRNVKHACINGKYFVGIFIETTTPVELGLQGKKVVVLEDRRRKPRAEFVPYDEHIEQIEKRAFYVQ